MIVMVERVTKRSIYHFKECVHYGFTKPSVPHSSKIRPVTEYSAAHTSSPPSPEPERINTITVDSNPKPERRITKGNVRTRRK